MRNQFKYILQDAEGHQLARITLPFVLNIGTQFEDPHSKGTFEVRKIIKEPPVAGAVLFYCRQINDTPWLYEHLEKSQYLVMNKHANDNI